MIGHSSVPPPYYGSDELDPLSPNFNPDGFADEIIWQESSRREKKRTQKGVIEIISNDRPAIGARFINPEKAAILELLADDSDSRGIYEDILPDMDVRGGRIDDENDEEEQPPEEDRLWDQEFEETQELLRKLEAGEIILSPDEDDD